MTTSLKLRRGTTAQHASFTGAEGEVTVDTTKDTVVVHDGSTAGGFPLAKEASLTSGLAAKADTTYVDGRLNTTFAFKNRIINGDMRIDQRNAGASITPLSPIYTVDRWITYMSQASKFSIQRVADAPAGFVNSVKITSLASTTLGSADYFTFEQAIEGFNIADLGWGTAAAKATTLSFRVKSSLTGTFGGAVWTSGYGIPFSYSIMAANTWTTISVSIPGPTAGSFPTDNSAGVVVCFGVSIGSNYLGTAGSWASGTFRGVTGQTNILATNAATWQITGVQLEVGASATPFDTRAYGTELALCERYCRIYGEGLIGTANTSTNSIWVQCPLFQAMRAAPSLSLKSTSIAMSDQFSADYTSSASVVTANQLSQNGGRFLINGFTGLTSGRWYGLVANGSASPYFILSSEL